MTALPTLNMAGWSILDYELAFAGIRQVNEASLWLQNQPRSFNSACETYHPGADFVVQIGEDWCGQVLSAVVDNLRTIRFSDPKHEERRILLLLQYATQWGAAAEPLGVILAMVAEQMRPAA